MSNSVSGKKTSSSVVKKTSSSKVSSTVQDPVAVTPVQSIEKKVYLLNTWMITVI